MMQNFNTGGLHGKMVQFGRKTKRCHYWILHRRPSNKKQTGSGQTAPYGHFGYVPESLNLTSSQRTGRPAFCVGVSYLEVQTSRARPNQIPKSVP